MHLLISNFVRRRSRLKNITGGEKNECDAYFPDYRLHTDSYLYLHRQRVHPCVFFAPRGLDHRGYLVLPRASDSFSELRLLHHLCDPTRHQFRKKSRFHRPGISYGLYLGSHQLCDLRSSHVPAAIRSVSLHKLRDRICRAAFFSLTRRKEKLSLP